jgi:hypothetical protein
MGLDGLTLEIIRNYKIGSELLKEKKGEQKIQKNIDSLDF